MFFLSFFEYAFVVFFRSGSSGSLPGFMPADLLVSFYCRCAFSQIHTFQNSVFAEFLFQFYRRFLYAALFFARRFFFFLLFFYFFNVVKKRKLKLLRLCPRLFFIYYVVGDDVHSADGQIFIDYSVI